MSINNDYNIFIFFAFNDIFLKILKNDFNISLQSYLNNKLPIINNITIKICLKKCNKMNKLMIKIY